MTIQIRHGVFETNSSSSHSLTMGKGNLVKAPFSKEILRAGVVNIGLGNYGCEWFRYYAPLEKLRYLLTHALEEVPSEASQEAVTARLREQYANVDVLCKLVKDYTGCDIVLQPGKRSLDDYAYNKFDHLFRNPEVLKQFIFDGDSFVQTGYDNTAMPWVIPTDFGRGEPAYAAHFRPVPLTHLPVKLRPLGAQAFWPSEGLATADGGVLTDTVNGELLAQIRSEGIVTHVRYHVHGPRDPSEGERDLRGRVLQSVLLPLGLRVSNTFSLDFEYVRVGRLADPARKKDELEIVMALPPALGVALRSLPMTGTARYHQLKAREGVRLWKKKLKQAQGKADATFEQEQLAKARALVEACDKALAKAQRLAARMQKGDA